ncbi:hypothetical protein EDD76_12086 [Kineothrix alysoides]|uniref:Uncharacterized protein n=1 Tax=Kineothrix alysoides TaxID=1469948 RepID=A0A4V2QB01_9FIRM|nr:hypothetical protein [Kineothrix alysoides]TCL54482.1 hypothetical protein EDD76_12086 [Kineothrix alysoides]
MDKTKLLKDLKRIEASLAAVIHQIESENTGITATIAVVRKIAILEEVFRAGGKVTAEEVSKFAIKYGKTPSSCAGYYSGKSPSMTTNEELIDDKALLKYNWFTSDWRYLTNTGLLLVREKRDEWGEDWLDRVPLDIVGSDANTLTYINF